MAFVGLLALGVFVGCVVVLGFKQAENDFVKGGAAIVAAALGGLPIAFANQHSTNSDAIFMYPIGLLLAVPWFYMPSIISVGDSKPWIRNLAIFGTVLLCSVAVAIAFSPPLRAYLR